MWHIPSRSLCSLSGCCPQGGGYAFQEVRTRLRILPSVVPFSGHGNADPGEDSGVLCSSGVVAASQMVHLGLLVVIVFSWFFGSGSSSSTTSTTSTLTLASMQRFLIAAFILCLRSERFADRLLDWSHLALIVVPSETERSLNHSLIWLPFPPTS